MLLDTYNRVLGNGREDMSGSRSRLLGHSRELCILWAMLRHDIWRNRLEHVHIGTLIVDAKEGLLALDLEEVVECCSDMSCIVVGDAKDSVAPR